MRYMVTPFELTERQLLIYNCLYKKCDFSNMNIKCTTEQIGSSIKVMEISNSVINFEIKKMIGLGYIRLIKKGSRGNFSIYELIKVNEVEVDNSKKVCKSDKNDNVKAKDNSYLIRIFNIWNDEDIIKHTKISKTIESAYKKASKLYKYDEIVKAISNYSKVINDDTFYYKHKFSLELFLKQGNAMSRFVDEGDIYMNYLENKKAPAPTSANTPKKNSYTEIICKNGKKYSNGREIV